MKIYKVLSIGWEFCSVYLSLSILVWGGAHRTGIFYADGSRYLADWLLFWTLLGRRSVGRSNRTARKYFREAAPIMLGFAQIASRLNPQ